MVEEADFLLLLLHSDFGALRARPLALLVVDVSLEFLHRNLALSACHVFQHRTEVAGPDEGIRTLPFFRSG